MTEQTTTHKPEDQPITQEPAQTPPKKGGKGWMIVAIIAILLLIGSIIYGYMSMKNLNKKISDQQAQINDLTSKKQTLEDAAASAATTTVVQSTQFGTITGKASYPSSSLPADEQVCAVSITNPSKVVCVNVGKNQSTNYSLQVPPGDYYVYATAEKELTGKAYYNEYSKCGNQASCPASGHTAYIPVKVTAGGTVSNVDPGDWYAPDIKNK